MSDSSSLENMLSAESKGVAWIKNRPEINGPKIIGFLVLDIFLISSYSYYYPNSDISKWLYIYSDTLISNDIVFMFIELVLFYLCFFTSKRVLSDFLKVDKAKIYVALKIFIIAVFIISLWELMLYGNTTIYHIFIKNSYRELTNGLWKILLIGFSEELIFKCLVLSQLLKRLDSTKRNRIFSFIITSLLFTLFHIPSRLISNEIISPQYVFTVFFLGYLSSILYVRHRNFLLVVLLHIFVDIEYIFEAEVNKAYLLIATLIIAFLTIPRISKSRIFSGSTRYSIPSIGFFIALGVVTLLAFIIPKHQNDYFNLSLKHNNLNNRYQALRLIKKATDLDSTNERFLINRGILYYNLKYYDSAWSDHNRVVLLNPGNNKAVFNRGLASIHQNNYDGCINDMNIVIKNRYNLSAAYGLRGTSYLRKRKYPEAKTDFNICLSLDSVNVQALQGLGNLYDKLAKYDSSLYYLTKAYSVNPESLEVVEDYAIANCKMQNFEISNKLMTKAIEMGSEHPMRYYVRGVNYFRKDDFYKAIEEFQRSIEYMEDDPKLYSYLGYSYLLIEDIEKSCEYFRKSADLGDQEAKNIIAKYCQ